MLLVANPTPSLIGTDHIPTASMRPIVLLAAVIALHACVSVSAEVAAAPPRPHLRHDQLKTPAGPWMSCFVTKDAAGKLTATVKPSVAGVTLSPSNYPFAKTEGARAQYNDTITETGWSYLHVVSNPAMSNSEQAYCAGFIEGKLSAHRIYEYAINGGANMTLPPPVRKFVDTSMAYLTTKISENPDSDFWIQVDVWRKQVLAVQEGFFAGCQGDECEVVPDVVMNINIGASLGNIAGKYGVEGTDPNFHPSLLDTNQGRCTGFVKLLPGNKELFIGQDTWTSFNSMTRVYKLMDTPFHLANGDIIPGRRQTFSSYPSSVFSGDDYYTLSSNLAVFETTIGTYNKTQNEFIVPQTVWESARNTIANRLAVDGESWTSLFATENNGCYNNQFLVLDYNKFQIGKPLQPNTLWMVEQLPGYTQAHDVTNVLEAQGYFGSYNLPYFKETVELSNITALVKEYGEWFTYNHTARANIMRRDHAKVDSIEAMKAFMRYNNFKHDPLARCPCDPPYTSENAIACRGDLNPANGTYNIGAFKQRNHAATDSKFTSAAMMASGIRTWAISSPTYDQQPVFVWSTSPYASVTHIGQPDRWEFPWVEVGFSD